MRNIYSFYLRYAQRLFIILMLCTAFNDLMYVMHVSGFGGGPVWLKVAWFQVSLI